MKLLQRNNSARGFTIVELLIVIVVIAILAAIVIVAYNGVQQRADNVKVASTVGQYARILSLYASEYGEYPADLESPAGTLVCLDGSTGCWNPAGNSAKSQTMRTELLRVSSTLPETEGMVVLYNSVPSTPAFTGYYITYIIRGSGDCPSIGGLAYLNHTNVGSDGDRRCRAALPTPSSL